MEPVQNTMSRRDICVAAAVILMLLFGMAVTLENELHLDAHEAHESCHVCMAQTTPATILAVDYTTFLVSLVPVSILIFVWNVVLPLSSCKRARSSRGPPFGSDFTFK